VIVATGVPYEKLVAAFEAELAISYDRPSSFLATLSQPELKQFGALLDQKIDGVIKAWRSKLKSYRLSRQPPAFYLKEQLFHGPSQAWY
jgi:hypothetical protein